MTRTVLLVVLLVVACKGKDKDQGNADKVPDKTAAVEGDGCSAVGAAIEKYWDTKIAAEPSSDARLQMRKTQAVAAARLKLHCEEDGWSAEAITCVKGGGDLKACESKLTEEQLKKIRASAQPIDVKDVTPPPSSGSGSN